MEPMIIHSLTVVVYSTDILSSNKFGNGSATEDGWESVMKTKWSSLNTNMLVTMTPKELCRWSLHSTPHTTASGTMSRNVSTTTKCAANRCPITHKIVGLVGSRAGLDDLGKNKLLVPLTAEHQILVPIPWSLSCVTL